MIYLFDKKVSCFSFDLLDEIKNEKYEKILIHFPLKIKDNNIFYINKISNKDFTKFFYPDILFKHNFIEKNIVLEDEFEIIKVVFKRFFSSDIFIFQSQEVKIPKIIEYINLIPISKRIVQFDFNESKTLNSIVENLKLSVTQENEFIHIAKKLKVREKNIKLLEEFIHWVGKDKKENKTFYDEIKKRILP